ncbi:MAG: hypothetical protein KBD44_01840, partial [Candidatus Pacebacteria bacterium]|nr:hypothetical protein [Candidatus Paceibacterota bacterium]
TNYKNAGSAEPATKEIDYFVHIGWNASAGTPFIGWARIPCTSIADIASYNTIDEKSLMCSQTSADGLVNADYMEVVGRFAATLSAGAGYTWSVPTYTAKNLIQRPIYETRALDWAPTWAGFSANPSGSPIQKYKLVGSVCKIMRVSATSGTSNATTMTMTVPFAFLRSIFTTSLMNVQDNSANQTLPGMLESSAGSATASLYKTFFRGAWTGSGTKDVNIAWLEYEI